MTRLSSYRDFDWVLLGFVLLLSLISVLEIKSATLHTKFHGFDTKQIGFLAIGLFLMFVVLAHRLPPPAGHRPLGLRDRHPLAHRRRRRRHQGPRRQALDQLPRRALPAVRVDQAGPHRQHGPATSGALPAASSPGPTSARPSPWSSSPCSSSSSSPTSATCPHLPAGPDLRSFSRWHPLQTGCDHRPVHQLRRLRCFQVRQAPQALPAGPASTPSSTPTPTRAAPATRSASR